MRFLLGLLVGLLLLGGYAGYQWYRDSRDPCLARCGVGTICDQARCVAQVDEQPKIKNKKRRRRRRRGRRRASAAAAEPQLRKVSARQLRPASKGPSLRQTDYVNLASSGGTKRELSTTEINARVRRLDPRIVGCIDQARADYDIRSGKVVVAFRIERSGRVSKVRVTAPQLLQQGGIYRCIARQIRALRFGPTARSLIMTYPYALR